MKSKYNIDHLIQPKEQVVLGPIQDDEALILFSIVHAMRLRYIVELGSQSGYSAQNFLKAVGPQGHVIGIDIAPTPKLADTTRCSSEMQH
jgi:predicted O-methyltransferase YrrM